MTTEEKQLLRRILIGFMGAAEGKHVDDIVDAVSTLQETE